MSLIDRLRDLAEPKTKTWVSYDRISKADARRVLALFEAAELANCKCSLAERQSGHLVGCWMPELTAALRDMEKP